MVAIVKMNYNPTYTHGVIPMNFKLTSTEVGQLLSIGLFYDTSSIALLLEVTSRSKK